jgi:hypothetical protein
MFSLWAKERWDWDGLSFSSKSVSRCFLVGMGIPFGRLFNVQDVNLSKL